MTDKFSLQRSRELLELADGFANPSIVRYQLAVQLRAALAVIQKQREALYFIRDGGEGLYGERLELCNAALALTEDS